MNVMKETEMNILAAREHHVVSEMHDGTCVYKSGYSTCKAF